LLLSEFCPLLPTFLLSIVDSSSNPHSIFQDTV
jgi:hypothetical protein